MTYTYKNFDEYLMSIFIEEEHPLDDLAPDLFGDWLAEQDVEDIMRLAELYGEHKVIEGMNKAIAHLEGNGINLQDELGGDR